MQNSYPDNDNLEDRECKQQRHYQLLAELQTMSSELPLQYQQRLPYELLSSLASILLDETIVSIVLSLRDLQQLLESSLYAKRVREIEHMKACRKDLEKRNQEGIALRTISAAEASRKEQEFELKMKSMEEELDKSIINELDQALTEQQITLEQANVPGFYVTNKPIEVRIQMYLLDFIVKLGKK